MTITERSVYLFLILVLLLLISLEYWSFTRHYEELERMFNIVWEHCK